jgi:hypothetical protein
MIRSTQGDGCAQCITTTASRTNPSTTAEHRGPAQAARTRPKLLITPRCLCTQIAYEYVAQFWTPPALPLVACRKCWKPPPNISGNELAVAAFIFAYDTSIWKPGVSLGAMIWWSAWMSRLARYLFLDCSRPTNRRDPPAHVLI